MMIFDPETMDATACYKLLIGSLVPRAIGWASTLTPDGIPNLAPFSFSTVVSRKPPMVSLSIQPRSDRRQLKDKLKVAKDWKIASEIILPVPKDCMWSMRR
jgi:flavin reductase (DIM6/NTAB) family NADH-FMN oxidoreductase RutF